jgi:hypothetical protein
MNEPKRTTSGKHEAVKAFRRKLESIQDGALADLEKLNRELAADIEKQKSDPPPEDAEPVTVPFPKVEQ